MVSLSELKGREAKPENREMARLSADFADLGRCLRNPSTTYWKIISFKHSINRHHRSCYHLRGAVRPELRILTSCTLKLLSPGRTEPRNHLKNLRNLRINLNVLYSETSQSGTDGATPLFQLTQFSTSKSVTLWNSEIFPETRPTSKDNAWPAINTSYGPMGVPLRCKSALTRAATRADR